MKPFPVGSTPSFLAVFKLCKKVPRTPLSISFLYLDATPSLSNEVDPIPFSLNGSSTIVMSSLDIFSPNFPLRRERSFWTASAEKIDVNASSRSADTTFSKTIL